MTKSAWLFLILSIVASSAALNLPAQGSQQGAFIASGVFASLFVGALIIGRRIKFDPVLR